MQHEFNLIHGGGQQEPAELSVSGISRPPTVSKESLLALALGR